MPRITAPIRKLYSVVCPEGVTASSLQVYDGDRLELSFSKEGFNTHVETVIVGTPSAYTKYEGSTIAVRSASQTGIRFERRIPVKVLSAKGWLSTAILLPSTAGPSIRWTLLSSFSKRTCSPTQRWRSPCSQTITALLKLKKPSAEMLVTEELELVMQPIEQGVTLRLDFGDGRVFEQQISIEKILLNITACTQGIFTDSVLTDL